MRGFPLRKFDAINVERREAFALLRELIAQVEPDPALVERTYDRCTALNDEAFRRAVQDHEEPTRRGGNGTL